MAKDYETRGLIFDSVSLRQRAANLQTFYTTSQRSDPARSNLQMSFVEHFVEAAGHWDTHEFAGLMERPLDLITLLLIEPNGFKAQADTSVRMAHRERALRYIRDHLSDPGLNP